MKVFMLSPVFNKSENYVYRDVVPDRSTYRSDLWRFDGSLKGDHWGRPAPAIRLLGGRRKPVGDFLACTPGSAFAIVDLLQSEAARILRDCGELLPVESPIDSPIAIVNVAPLVDCLDVERSAGLGGNFIPALSIKKFVFDANRLPARSVFKIPEWSWRIFASEGIVPRIDDFKAVVEEHGYRGLHFREVWNDDGDPVEDVEF